MTIIREAIAATLKKCFRHEIALGTRYWAEAARLASDFEEAHRAAYFGITWEVCERSSTRTA